MFKKQMIGKEDRSPENEHDPDASVYDVDHAVNFVFSRLEHPRSVIERLLMEKDIYGILMGVVPVDTYEEYFVDGYLEGKKNRNADLCASEPSAPVRSMNWDEEAEFIYRETGIQPKVVTEILREEIRYAVTRSIMDPEAVGYYQEWAEGWLRSIEEGRK